MLSDGHIPEDPVQKIFRDCGLWPPREKIRTVLDVGCGTALRSQLMDCDLRLGVDIHVPYLEQIKSCVPYAALVGDATKLRETFLARSFDVVLLLGVIEHVEKSQSRRMLKDAEEIARVAVVLETPNGIVFPKFADAADRCGEHWQTRRCDWKPAELEELGYATSIRAAPDPARYELISAIKRLDA